MSTTPDTPLPGSTTQADIATGAWRLDPQRSSVEFHVRNFYGLMTVKGRFERYRGTLTLSTDPAIELVIDADSLDTKNARRDKHLRSADFFDAENHPKVRFISDRVALGGDRLTIHGALHAGGSQLPLDLEAKVTRVGEEFEIEAVAQADHRTLGMTWSPIGILRAPSTLLVRGRLVRDAG